MHQYLQSSVSKLETEGLILVAQNQILLTISQTDISRNGLDSKCRFCTYTKIIEHRTSVCSNFVTNEFKITHDWNICQHYNLPHIENTMHKKYRYIQNVMLLPSFGCQHTRRAHYTNYRRLSKILQKTGIQSHTHDENIRQKVEKHRTNAHAQDKRTRTRTPHI